MTVKEKLYYLLYHYKDGEYDTNTFCDQFTIIYNTEVDYNTLSETEHKVFRELDRITSRFSPYKEDFKIPNLYHNEHEVKSKVEEVINRLSQIHRI